MLKPGSQAVINYLDAGSQDSTVHVFENFASKWKENEFDFHNENITGMMKQIGRYYNKQIIYEGKPGDGKYTAIISHDKDIDSLIQKLKIYKIHVKNEGDKLIVTP
jgi:ferric-dicitrate binding protein FerR (iron transport regulator)